MPTWLNDRTGRALIVLSPLELWTPLLAERLDAFLVVLAVEAVRHQLVEQREIALLRRLEELLDRVLGGLDGERRVARDLLRVVPRERLQLGLGDDLVHEAHAQRLLRREVRARGEEELLRVRRADQVHE